MNGDFDKAYLRELAYKWKNGKLTAAEQQFLNDWENSHLDELLFLPDYSGGPEAVKQNMLNHLLAGMEAERVKAKTTKLWPRMATIAAAVAAIVFGIWFYHAHYTNDSQVGGRHPELVSGSQDIAPGKNTATLTLANGKTITLSDAKTGVVIDATSLKYNDGTVVDKQLSPSGGDAAGRGGRNSMMLTATTPRGGTYQFTLPDGTQVWLNAASKISFPAQFSGQTRKILLSGEAYFEVARDEKHPFVVKTGSQETEVLGTHFNINDYGHPYVRTTLLEGSIRVKNFSIPGRADEVVLKPNQEAVIHELALSVRDVKASDAAAWKDGKFRFDNIYLEEVMAQLSRWYDVEVRYPDGLPMIKLSGGIDRRVTLSVALDILKDLNVKFKVAGKVISIYK